MRNPNISLLGYSLLGLLQQEPRSGYDLRKMFAITPLMSFSDSPGAIYPALGRLEEHALIRGRIEAGSGLRRRKVFQLTAAGTAELKKWLRMPLTRDHVVQRMNELMLRFAFTDEVLGEAASIAFLKTFSRELKSHITTLQDYVRAGQSEIPISGRLALESGIRGYEAQLQWARMARAAYEQKMRGAAS